MIHKKPDYEEYLNPKMAEMYDIYNQHYPLEKQFYFDLAAQIKANKIIDIGCGTGLLTIPMANVGYEMVGVEPAEAMLNIARQNPDANKVEWIHGDALLLSEEDADLAIMTAHVAQFLLEDEYFLDCLSSINRSLRDGGYLVFDSKNTGVTLSELGWPTKENPRKRSDSVNEPMEWWTNILETKGNRILYEIHTQIQNAQEMVSTNELIFRTKEEITEFLVKSNFTVERIYGDWDRSGLIASSPEMIFVAKKNTPKDNL